MIGCAAARRFVCDEIWVRRNAGGDRVSAGRVPAGSDAEFIPRRCRFANERILPVIIGLSICNDPQLWKPEHHLAARLKNFRRQPAIGSQAFKYGTCC